MREFFHPSSVVIIGVSKKPMNLGKEIARNCLEFGYDGVIHLVGSAGGVIFGRKIHTSLDDISEPIDLAVILTPSSTIPDLLEQCGKKGIRRVVVESGGFGEFGDSGRVLSDTLKRIIDTYGMRLIGPNCIGIMNASNGLAIPFPTLRNVFPRGGVGIIAQSGGVALSFLNIFEGEQIGYSKFAAIGNKVDVDENDMIEYYVEDPETTVVSVYLESIKDGRRLARIGRNSPKPIVVHKANISPMSSQAAQSHTEALANDDQVVDAALQQSGIARFRDMQAFLDFVKILQLPRMKGRNLAIVSRSGGHAVMAADAASACGFRLPPFRSEFLESVQQQLRANVIRLANPLDLGDLFDFQAYLRILEYTIQQENVDGILFMHTYFAAVEGETARKLLHEAAALTAKYGKPIVVVPGTENHELSRLYKELDYPIFGSAGRAVAAMDASIKHYRRREFMAEHTDVATPSPLPDDHSIQSILDRARSSQRPVLLHEALEVVRHAGLSMPQFAFVSDTESLESQISGLVAPYALKIVAEDVSHKSDVDGVILRLVDGDAVQREFVSMKETAEKQPEQGFHGAVVQEMAKRQPGSYELIVGGKRDPQFGPMVLVGYGGIFVEVFEKASLRMVPLSEGEIEEMIDQIHGSEILDGLRGLPPVDRSAIVDAVVRIAYLMEHFPEIDQIDVNPLLASPSGALALDARIILGEEAAGKEQA